jgi:hypothetical protein
MMAYLLPQIIFLMVPAGTTTQLSANEQLINNNILDGKYKSNEAINFTGNGNEKRNYCRLRFQSR